MKFRAVLKSWTVAIACSGTIAAHAATGWDDDSNGDLSNDGLAPTFVSVAAGSNHVLPTGGLARGYSGLSTEDFYRWTTIQRVTRATARALAADVGTFADAEGLPAHAAAARQWRTA